MLAKTIWLIDGMRVYPDRMQRNLDSTKGLIFSGQLLLDLSAAGMLREDAYKVVQGYAVARLGERRRLFARQSVKTKKSFLFYHFEKISRPFLWTATSPKWIVFSSESSAQRPIRNTNLGGSPLGPIKTSCWI
jgi:adenylosuccinate lyase